MENIIVLENGRWIKESEQKMIDELVEKMRPKTEKLLKAAMEIEAFNRYIDEENEKIANGDADAINRRYLNRFK